MGIFGTTARSYTSYINRRSAQYNRKTELPGVGHKIMEQPRAVQYLKKKGYQKVTEQYAESHDEENDRPHTAVRTYERQIHFCEDAT